ncbi:hypothetical protein Bca52824_033290 [Brassica carinata]|uniref:Uncharacterized protein n=1 Tax=Brassica carinata TaxID=52824 RepID=A0A8X7SCK2_BRACI|nr:hypothetical protein Bca52824_033290 [Brassica carinata]
MGTRGKEKDMEKGLSTPERTPKVSGMNRTTLPWPRWNSGWAVVGLVKPDPSLLFSLLIFL